MDTSILWIAPHNDAGRTTRLRAARAASLLPVFVDSVEGALALIRQFRVAAVALPVTNWRRGCEDCVRLTNTGTRVVVILDDHDPQSVLRYQEAGCAAVVARSCSPDEVATVLQRVAGGERDIAWPPLIRASA